MNKFLSNIPAKTELIEGSKQIWAHFFEKHEINEDRVLIGIDKCIKQGLQYPPSLPEFILLCLPDHKNPNHPSFGKRKLPGQM